MTCVVTARSFRLRPVVLALACVEARRLALHPVLLGGLATSVLASVSFAAQVPVGGPYLILNGALLFPLGLATLVAANLAALRDRRSRIGETYAAAPAPPAARTLAHLAALAVPAAMAAVTITVAAVAFEAWEGLQVTRPGRSAVPTLPELLQGPLAIVAMGTFGIALARWVPHPVAPFVAAVALFAVQMPAVMWNYAGAQVWFLPLVNPALPSGDSSWPCAAAQASPCEATQLAIQSVAWHAAYLIALAVLFGTLALLRHGGRRGATAAAVAVVPVVLLGLVQQP